MSADNLQRIAQPTDVVLSIEERTDGSAVCGGNAAYGDYVLSLTSHNDGPRCSFNSASLSKLGGKGPNWWPPPDPLRRPPASTSRGRRMVSRKYWWMLRCERVGEREGAGERCAGPGRRVGDRHVRVGDGNKGDSLPWRAAEAQLRRARRNQCQ